MSPCQSHQYYPTNNSPICQHRHTIPPMNANTAPPPTTTQPRHQRNNIMLPHSHKQKPMQICELPPSRIHHSSNLHHRITIHVAKSVGHKTNQQVQNPNTWTIRTAKYLPNPVFSGARMNANANACWVWYVEQQLNKKVAEVSCVFRCYYRKYMQLDSPDCFSTMPQQLLHPSSWRV